MAIYRNGKKMKGVCRGETKIDKVYRGSKLIADYIERITSVGTNVKLLTRVTGNHKQFSSVFDEFKLYGWSKQASTPSVNSPQEIVSAGMSGTVNVIERGNNILPRGDLMYYREMYTTDIIPWTGDTSMTLSGTVFTNNDEGEYHVYVDYLDTNQKYLGTNGCSEKCGKAVTSINQVFDGSYAGENSTHLDLKNDVKYIQLHFFIYNDTANEVSYNKLMLNVGNTALPYEVYQGCQSLTLQTPNGLPGIPVDSGGNYTDANGQKWIADYIDLARGKYVQWVWQKEFDGSDDENISYVLDNVYLIGILPNKMTNRHGLSNYSETGLITSGTSLLELGRNDEFMYVYWDETDVDTYAFVNPDTDKYVTKFREYLSTNPLIVMTYLDEPIERDLTAEEIAAYKALMTYDNATTVVSTNQNVTMSAKYPKRYSTTT